MKQEKSPETTRKFSVTKYSKEGYKEEDVDVVAESSFQILINDEQVAAIMLTPSHLEEFLIGFLVGQGIVKSIDDINNILIEPERGLLYAQVKEPFQVDLTKSFVTSGCAGGVSFESFKGTDKVQKSKLPEFSLISDLMKKMISEGEIYPRSGGIHSAALADDGGIIFQVEDIGRHNCIDKVIGYLVKNNIEPKGKMILTTGRLSLEAVPKIARAGINILGSRSTATDLAVEAAKRFGVTLLGYIRAGKVTVYNQ